MITVTPADIQDRDAARDVFWRLRLTQPQITHVWADRGYAGDLVSRARERLWLTLRIVSRQPRRDDTAADAKSLERMGRIDEQPIPTEPSDKALAGEQDTAELEEALAGASLQLRRIAPQCRPSGSLTPPRSKPSPTESRRSPATPASRRPRARRELG